MVQKAVFRRPALLGLSSYKRWTSLIVCTMASQWLRAQRACMQLLDPWRLAWRIALAEWRISWQKIWHAAQLVHAYHVGIS
jgi:hypothetical protein